MPNTLSRFTRGSAHRLPPIRVLLAAAILAPAAIAAQTPLRLAEALARADAQAYANRGALARARGQQAAGTATLRGILPSVRLESGWMKTTDPIGAFGTTLRQRAVTQQAFEPARLNYPGGTPNYAAALVIEQPLFNADAWAARRAARSATAAQDAMADWTIGETRLDVVNAWFGSILALEKVRMLTTSLRAAREHVRQAESMARNGLVTPSDAMLASVKAGEVESLLIEAEGQVAIARVALATAMGSPRDTLFELPAELPTEDALASLGREARQLQPVSRADVLSATTAQQAASADLTRARAAWLPRLNSFARQDWNSALRPFGGASNWTVGVMAVWTPFAGAQDIAETRAAESRLDAASAMQDGAVARAALDDARTARGLDAALARLAIAGRAVRQGADAHRIIARKYEAGLATVVELLDAAAGETQTRLTYAAARHAGVIAIAERHRALGHDPAVVARLDTPSSIAADQR